MKALFVFFSLLSVVSARADVVGFVDAIGTPTAASTFGGDFIFCGSSPCSVLVTGHADFVSVTSLVTSFSISPTIYIGDGNGIVIDRLVSTVSVLPFLPPSPGSVTNLGLVLSTALELGSPFTCASVGGCQFTADGSVQTLGTVSWTYGADTEVTFQAVGPEPATVGLLLLGVTGLAASRFRNRKSSTFAPAVD